MGSDIETGRGASPPGASQSAEFAAALMTVAARVHSGQRFLVVAHARVDGDAIGAMLVSAHGLRALGKQAYLYNPESVARRFHFLPGATEVRRKIPADLRFDATLVHDCGARHLLGEGFPPPEVTVTALPWDFLRTLLPLFLTGLAVALAFVKLSVVLAVLRRGLGGGVPPTAVTALLALLLATLAMAPTAERCQRLIASQPPTSSAQELLQAGGAPLREFLKQHTPAREQQAVLELAQRLAPQTPERPAATLDQLAVLAPAFALSELRIAFLLGFGLLLPLLLIDLLCAVLLSGLELGALSPRAVALPFKLLLFVLCNGWQLVLRALLLGYL